MAECGVAAGSQRGWIDPGRGGELPSGTVTVLSAGIEEARRGDAGTVAAATTVLDHTLPELTATHRGTPPVRNGEDDSFVVAFSRASDAVACAIDLQTTSPAPIKLRIGLHTGEIRQPGDTGYPGPTVNRAVQLRDLAHGGQTVLSEVTESLVTDRLPAGAWLVDLGWYPLRGVLSPERVTQVCHPQLANDFPSLRAGGPVLGGWTPTQLTNFIGRKAELAEVRQLVVDNRLVTLTGAGGVGKTRLAVRLADAMLDDFAAGVWWVDLAPITDPELTPVRVARTLGLSDQPGRSTTETLTRFVANRQLLLVMDNCEHLLDSCATLTTAMLTAGTGVTVLATSREPLGVAGELAWRTPSLSLSNEAVELFVDRARLARPDFEVTANNAAALAEICRRLDGVPLAIELAAARTRALSPTEIVDGLFDRFRLLTGGARAAVPRQQTLRASVDWSHSLLSEPERVLFRRLAVFPASFDLNAAHAVAGGTDSKRYQTLDTLSLLVEKSLVVADDRPRVTRYRLPETVRQYALERLGESGDADSVRTRHREYYSTLFDEPVSGRLKPWITKAITEIDNLRGTFAWSLDNGHIQTAARLASNLQPLWLRGRILEGLSWFDAILADGSAPPDARARALADKAILDHLAGNFDRTDQGEQALAIAWDLDDRDLLARALTGCAVAHIFNVDVALPYFAEAIEIARSLGDDWQLSWILGWGANSAYMAGDPAAAQAAAEEGEVLADVIGDGFISRMCHWIIGLALWLQADLPTAVRQFSEVVAVATAAGDAVWRVYGQFALAKALAYQGDTVSARSAAEAAVEAAADLTGFQKSLALGALAESLVAAGDATAAVATADAAWRSCPRASLLAVNAFPLAQAALAAGDLAAARHAADDAVAAATGVHRMTFLAVRARIALTQGDFERAELDVRDALSIAEETRAYLTVPDVLECMASLLADSAHHEEAARLLGAAASVRDRTGQVRFKSYDDDHRMSMLALRERLGNTVLDECWAWGAALSVDEAVDYAVHGRGPHRRPTRGWAALTATEHEVISLVSEGLGNKDIATRLVVSPRTVQSHLTHVYTKLGVHSRVQLARVAAQRSRTS